MFYSHEVLTSRKYGVATVWLVATMGSKSGLKKVNRKAILDVNVPKACQTVLTPEAPMALRLQGHLLYGVSRVFYEQCNYVLNDTRQTQNRLQSMVRLVTSTALDPAAGKTNPDQLILPDDPGYFENLSFPALDLDFARLELASAASRSSSLISPQSDKSTRPGAEQSNAQIVIPSSDSGSHGRGAGFDFPAGAGSFALGEEYQPAGEDDHLFADVGFEFDAEGNMREVSAPQQDELGTEGLASRPRVEGSSRASSQVRREHDEGFQAIRDFRGALLRDQDLPADRDYEVLPDAEPFQSPARENDVPELVRTPSEYRRGSRSSSSSPAEAPIRRKRRLPQAFEMDDPVMLGYTKLAEWRAEYIENMDEVTRSRQTKRLPHIAKKNANFWVFGAGLGGTGVFLGSSNLPGPLRMFSGNDLLQNLGLSEVTTATAKRGRDEAEHADTYGEERRTRPRLEEEQQEQAGRGENVMRFEDDEIMRFENEIEGIEVGRQAPPSLPDLSSVLPWNSASVHGGSRPGSALPRARGLFMPSSGGGGGGAFSSSIGGPAGGSAYGLAPIPAPSRRLTRIIPSSPLAGRGRVSGLDRLSSLEIPDLAADEDLLGHGGPLPGAADEDVEFQPFPEPAPQSTAPHPAALESLDLESVNFLAFVRDGVAQHQHQPQPVSGENGGVPLAEEGGTASPRQYVLFEELIAPGAVAKAVAAQAFLHTLVLATGRFLGLEQREGYGEIRMMPLVEV